MRKFIFSAGVVLFVLAASCLYVGVSELSDIRPASDYEDKGIHTFMPYQTLTTQVKNTATGRQQRLHPQNQRIGSATEQQTEQAMSGKTKLPTGKLRKILWLRVSQ